VKNSQSVRRILIACAASIAAASALTAPSFAGGGGPCTPSWQPDFETWRGADNRVVSLAVYEDAFGVALHAGGSFTTVGAVVANGIARWDGTSWVALGSGVAGSADAMAVFDDGTGAALYVGGFFSTAGGVPASGIARWDGTSWTALGTGLINGESTGSVDSMAVFDDGSGEALYVGGGFTMAGSVVTTGIARWDGTAWSDVGGGLNSVALAMTVFDDGGGDALYATGSFVSAGGVPASRIAKWDGSNWTPLGSGLNLWGNALAVFDDGGGDALYVTGRFSFAGGSHMGHIAKWDGSSWSSLGSGLAWIGRALAVFDGELVVGGEFASGAGGLENKIATWDGTSYGPVGSGMNNDVYALTVYDDGSGDALFAAGEFTVASGVSANRIAKWGCGTTTYPAFCDLTGGAFAACPCANYGQIDAGCDSPIPPMQGGGTTGGVRLDIVAQSFLPNRVTVTATGYPTGSTPGAVVIRASQLNSAAPVAFGDGVRCIGVPLVRLGAAAAAAGVSTHTFGHGAMAGTGAFYYQAWFRSTPASYCTPDAFNLSNGRIITW
jgi:hypothetical protein